MNQILTDIQDGTYARKWIEENEAGRPWFNQRRNDERSHMIEQVGAQLRAMMPFLDPVTIDDVNGVVSQKDKAQAK